MKRYQIALNAKVWYRIPRGALRYGRINSVCAGKPKRNGCPAYYVGVDCGRDGYRRSLHTFFRLDAPPAFLDGQTVWVRRDILLGYCLESIKDRIEPYRFSPAIRNYIPATVSKPNYDQLVKTYQSASTCTPRTKPVFWRLMVLQVTRAVFDGNRSELSASLDTRRVSA